MTTKSQAAKNTMQVTLNSSGTLDVDDKDGKNALDASDEPQVVTWRLKGALKQGEFAALDDPGTKPGFEWITPPPPAAFGPPMPWANGKALSIVDFHTDAATGGMWVYKLRVKLGDKTYETTSSIGAADTSATSKATLMVSNNPVIINR